MIEKNFRELRIAMKKVNNISIFAWL